ncbi:hypothetical protein [Neisseria sp.]|uniref:hypothetical protein n=1 Tax=Neisseria sp. TaxID=192066 RepID=UPI00359FEFC9
MTEDEKPVQAEDGKSEKAENRESATAMPWGLLAGTIIGLFVFLFFDQYLWGMTLGPALGLSAGAAVDFFRQRKD